MLVDVAAECFPEPVARNGGSQAPCLNRALLVIRDNRAVGIAPLARNHKCDAALVLESVRMKKRTSTERTGRHVPMLERDDGCLE